MTLAKLYTENTYYASGWMDGSWAGVYSDPLLGKCLDGWAGVFFFYGNNAGPNNTSSLKVLPY